jgi:hypothetical protein
VNAHTKSRFRQAERRRASGDAASDNGDVYAAVVAAILARRNGIFEPVRIQDVER